MTTSEIANELRTMAERVEAVTLHDMPRQALGPWKAARELFPLIGDDLCVTVDIWPAHPNVITFDIWDGNKHHKSTDLKTAVEMCVAANTAKNTPLQVAGPELDRQFAEAQGTF